MYLKTIQENRNYWFVRTEGGSLYEEFRAKGIIAIGWERIDDIDLIRAAAKDGEANLKLLDTIQKAYPEERRHKYVARQIMWFVNDIKEGDVVLIPSIDSWYISFGEVQSDEIIPIAGDEEGNCDWEKRKRVKWLKTIKRNDLDPYLFKLFYSRHAVTNANSYAPFIDRTLHSLFIKGDTGHLILEVRTKEKVLASDLLELLSGCLGILNTFNGETKSELDVNSIGIKINVQSPGPIHLFGNPETIWAIAALLHLIVGGRFEFSLEMIACETDGLLGKILQFREQSHRHRMETRQMEAVIKKLQVVVPSEIATAFEEAGLPFQLGRSTSDEQEDNNK